MATRNILDSNGNIIGTMTLPDTTTEEQWAEALSHYTYVVPQKTINDIVDSKIQASINFGLLIIKNATSDNVIAGITAAGKTREVSDYLSNLERYLRSGSLYAAIDELTDLANGSIPSDIQTWVSVDKLNAVKLQIQTFLGVTP